MMQVDAPGEELQVIFGLKTIKKKRNEGHGINLSLRQNWRGYKCSIHGMNNSTFVLFVKGNLNRKRSSGRGHMRS